MNLLSIHKIVIQENEILKLQNKLQKETDEKKKNDLKMEIIRLNGKIKKEEIGRVG
jgi:hypothetical protein